MLKSHLLFKMNEWLHEIMMCFNPGGANKDVLMCIHTVQYVPFPGTDTSTLASDESHL